MVPCSEGARVHLCRGYWNLRSSVLRGFACGFDSPIGLLYECRLHATIRFMLKSYLQVPGFIDNSRLQHDVLGPMMVKGISPATEVLRSSFMIIPTLAW